MCKMGTVVGTRPPMSDNKQGGALRIGFPHTRKAYGRQMVLCSRGSTPAVRMVSTSVTITQSERVSVVKKRLTNLPTG